MIAKAAGKQATDLWNEAQKAAVDPYDDPILKRVTTIIGKDFGKHPGDDNLAAAREVALKRIAARVPPGYMDDTKADGGIGDPLIWMELVRLAVLRQLPIIFVTSENKEDWWEKGANGKKRIGPRHELVTEMQKQAGVVYVQMDPTQLQRYGKDALDIATPEAVFEELREVSQEPEPAPVRYRTATTPAWSAAASWPALGPESAIASFARVAQHFQEQNEQWGRVASRAVDPAYLLGERARADIRAIAGLDGNLGASSMAAIANATLAGMATGRPTEDGVLPTTLVQESRVNLAENALGLSGHNLGVEPEDDES